MKDYIKPEVEFVDFATENITDGIGDTGGGNTSNLIPDDPNNFS